MNLETLVKKKEALEKKLPAEYTEATNRIVGLLERHPILAFFAGVQYAGVLRRIKQDPRYTNIFNEISEADTEIYRLRQC